VVVDIGCGSGDLCIEAANRGATVVGIDPAGAMLKLARRRAPTTHLVRAVGENLPLASASCDAVVSGFALRNWSAIDEVLSECGRVLSHGGRLAILEIDEPSWAPMRSGFRLYFNRIVPLLGSMLSSGDAYRYLADSLVYLPRDIELHRMLAQAGFDDIAKQRLTAGVAQLVTATRKRHD
jgi:demethylmenaquinone methyltransferase/2-methoxy-6-polyprenyl-1,4-benzoquinol methylase